MNATARDEAGTTAQASHTVLVLNRGPEILDVGPLTAEANTTHVLDLEARDPDGDPVEATWSGPDRTAWGGQYHLSTGSPGNVAIEVNVTDPYDAWVTANVTVRVVEDAGGTDEVEGGGLEVTDQDTPGDRSPSDRASPEDPPDAPALVLLPEPVRGHNDVATRVDGRARQPDGNVTAVQVVLGEPVPVRGTEAFEPLLPALPPAPTRSAREPPASAGPGAPGRTRPSSWTTSRSTATGRPTGSPRQARPSPWTPPRTSPRSRGPATGADGTRPPGPGRPPGRVQRSRGGRPAVREAVSVAGLPRVDPTADPGKRRIVTKGTLIRGGTPYQQSHATRKPGTPSRLRAPRGGRDRPVDEPSLGRGGAVPGVCDPTAVPRRCRGP